MMSVTVNSQAVSGSDAQQTQNASPPAADAAAVQKWQASYSSQTVGNDAAVTSDGEVEDGEHAQGVRMLRGQSSEPAGKQHNANKGGDIAEQKHSSKQSNVDLLSMDKKYRDDSSPLAAQLAAHAPPTSQNEAAAQAAASTLANADASLTNSQDELVTLLKNFCDNVYLASQPGFASAGRVVLDVGKMLPGCMVEIVRNGAFLQVRLHTSDKKLLELMQRARGKLVESLSESTDLVVTVDAVERDGQDSQQA